MKKKFKVIILIVMCLAIVGIYLGKNIYFKKENLKEQANANSQSENTQEITSNGPSLLEFSTET